MARLIKFNYLNYQEKEEGSNGEHDLHFILITSLIAFDSDKQNVKSYLRRKKRRF